MMCIKSSLMARILALFFLNLLMVGAVLLLVYSIESHMDLGELFGRDSRGQLRNAGSFIVKDLENAPQSKWAQVLSRYGSIYDVTFFLVGDGGEQVLPTAQRLPPDVLARTRSFLEELPSMSSTRRNRDNHGFYGRRSHGDLGDDGHGEGKAHWGRREHIKEAHEKASQRLFIHTRNPERYWAAIPVRLYSSPWGGNPSLILVASDSATGNGFFFDPKPWVITAGIVMLFSSLLWVPMVRNITGPLKRMTGATEAIAKGDFKVRITEIRSDEIGRLATAINHMTTRLSGYVAGQKRFLGDVAHELGSPIARIQFGLGVLEYRLEGEGQEHVQGVMDDVELLSTLVAELLSFSRAEMNPARVQPISIRLLPLVEKVVRREGSQEGSFAIEVPSELDAVADPELLVRALANLLRNAQRYAGDAGPIVITSEIIGDQVALEVKDQGPGVPDELLDQVFEPFYRPEASRGRDTGGVGLGLAIVKTCVEACGGHVAARNRAEGGFAVTLWLNRQGQ